MNIHFATLGAYRAGQQVLAEGTEHSLLYQLPHGSWMAEHPDGSLCCLIVTAQQPVEAIPAAQAESAAPDESAVGRYRLVYGAPVFWVATLLEGTLDDVDEPERRAIDAWMKREGLVPGTVCEAKLGDYYTATVNGKKRPCADYVFRLPADAADDDDDDDDDAPYGYDDATHDAADGYDDVAYTRGVYETHAAPAAWAVALINGDYSGLTDLEQEELHEWLALEDLDPALCVGAQGEPYTARFNGLLTLVHDYEFRVA